MWGPSLPPSSEVKILTNFPICHSSPISNQSIPPSPMEKIMSKNVWKKVNFRSHQFPNDDAIKQQTYAGWDWLKCGLQAAGHRLRVAGHRLRAAGHRLRAAGHKLRAAGMRAVGHRLRTAGHRLQAEGMRAAGHRLPAMGHRLRAAGRVRGAG